MGFMLGRNPHILHGHDCWCGRACVWRDADCVQWVAAASCWVHCSHGCWIQRLRCTRGVMLSSTLWRHESTSWLHRHSHDTKQCGYVRSGTVQRLHLCQASTAQRQTGMNCERHRWATLSPSGIAHNLQERYNNTHSLTLTLTLIQPTFKLIYTCT